MQNLHTVEEYFRSCNAEEFRELARVYSEANERIHQESLINNKDKIQKLDWLDKVDDFFFREENEMMNHCSYQFNLMFNPKDIPFLKHYNDYIIVYKNEDHHESSIYQHVCLIRYEDSASLLAFASSNKKCLLDFIKKYNIKIKFEANIKEKAEFYAEIVSSMGGTQ